MLMCDAKKQSTIILDCIECRNSAKVVKCLQHCNGHTVLKRAERVTYS